MFDHLYAVAEGNCIYQGSVQRLLPFLADMGLTCPAYHNPADYRKCAYQMLVNLKENGTVSEVLCHSFDLSTSMQTDRFS
jgi:hypothetical protein